MQRKLISANELPTFDPAEHLRSDEDIEAYLRLVLEEGDPEELPQALGIIARAKGMTQIAKDAGVAREALYRSLTEGASPRFETVARVLKALGLRFSVARA